MVQFERVDEKKEKKILTYLKQHSNVTWITTCAGEWDLIFVVMARNPAHFDQTLRDIMGEIGTYVHDYKVATSIGSKTFGPTYILGDVKEATTPKKIDEKEIVFDDIDKRIAQCVRTNARARLLHISRKTDIPVDTVKQRLRKMVERRLIKRFRCIIDSSILGYNRYEVFIRCPHLTDHTVRQFMEFAKQEPAVEFISKTVGAWDVEMTVHCRSNEEMRAFNLRVKNIFGNEIIHYEIVALFNTFNYVYLPEELR